MNTQTQWLHDLADAVEELGYALVRIGPDGVVLSGPDRFEVEVRSPLLSAAALRRILRPAAEREPVSVWQE